MKTLKLTCIILLLAVAGYAQNNFKQLAPDVLLVADETELVLLKSSFKVETCNEAIFSLLKKEFTALGFRYTATIKSDRKGLYTLYSIPFKMVDMDRVKAFFTKIK